jgi:hypothetical protein
MATTDRATMEWWVQRVFELNATYERVIGLSPLQQVGPPATEAQIAAFEAWLGWPLPPSYRLFLSLHDGWKGFQAHISLLSIAEQRQGEAADYIRSWKAEEWAQGEALIVEGLVIGVEVGAGKGWIIDTSHRDERGEMDVVYWNSFETGRTPDFLAMLQHKAKLMEELIAEDRGKVH